MRQGYSRPVCLAVAPGTATTPGHPGQLALWLGNFHVRAYLGTAAFPPPGARPPVPARFPPPSKSVPPQRHTSILHFSFFIALDLSPVPPRHPILLHQIPPAALCRQGQPVPGVYGELIVGGVLGVGQAVALAGVEVVAQNPHLPPAIPQNR